MKPTKLTILMNNATINMYNSFTSSDYVYNPSTNTISNSEIKLDMTESIRQTMLKEAIESYNESLAVVEYVS